ncbi:signal peptidase I [Acidaminococcus sp. CAG:917]|nr:signal peptidase I [Acidaminococcus sp. CAG:917]
MDEFKHDNLPQNLDLEDFSQNGSASGKKKKTAAVLTAIGLSVLVAVIVAIIVIAVVCDTFVVDGSSMYPTLYGGKDNVYTDGDKVVVNKYKTPDVGDIVVVHPKGQSTMIKRVVAVAGDTVKVVGGVLYVNGAKADTSYLSDKNKLMYASYPDTLLDMAEFTVKQGHIWVLGDNRLVSHDSRDPKIGQVSLDEVLGTVFLIITEDKKLNWI